ncbi:MAG: 4Fe-4S binding protein [PVC group bacterium]
MAYHISDECVSCGTCQPECPVEAISEGTPYVIDPEKCTDCGACATICPVEAISEDE